MPIASISAYIVVGPTWAKPAFFSALRQRHDSGEVVAISPVSRGAGGGLGAERPDERVQPALLAQRDGGPRVGDRGVDLAAVAHDAGVGHQPLGVGVVVRRDRVGVEAGEGLAEVSRLFRIVSQDSPDWNASSVSRSRWAASPSTGIPHSVSW